MIDLKLAAAGMAAAFVIGALAGVLFGRIKWWLPVKVYALERHLVPTTKSERKKLRQGLARHYRAEMKAQGQATQRRKP